MSTRDELESLCDELDAREAELSARFLSDLIVRVAAGTLPAVEEEDDVRAYILLVHAAAEECLEAMVLKVAKEALRQYKAGAASIAALGLATFRPGDASIGESWVSGRKSSARNSLSDQFQRAYQAHVNVARKSNHGIKEANICELLRPLGIAASSIPPDALTCLETVGELRGSVAHKSRDSGIKTHRVHDPVTVQGEARRMIAHFRADLVPAMSAVV